MIGFSDILPVYPGFALGCIISQSDLYLPIYEKKRASLEEALERATQDKDKEKEREKFKASDNERISKLTTVSFISQGVIPKLNPKIQDINLLNVYVNWKEALVSDPHSGYPIGFKVRRLQNVLEENHILS